MNPTPEAAVGDALTRHAPRALGLAVSGGGDSLALMLLMAEAARARGLRAEAATVDHGLRAASGAEAALVAARAAKAGIRHEILLWKSQDGRGHDGRGWDGRGWDGRGNLQAAAREARRRLLADWAARRGLDQLWLGHTADDQAETFLLRLARGSGIDGLSAMAEAREEAGLTWVRPLLAVRRDVLRAWLAERGESWVEDPSNDDPRFDRIRLRQAMPALAGLGLTPERLLLAAGSMARARQALEGATAALARQAARISPAGEIIVHRAAYADAAEEIRLRLLARSLAWVGGRDQVPRLESLTLADAGLRQGRAGFTLHGCVLRAQGQGFAIRREVARLAAPVGAGLEWDGRWRVSGPKDLPPDVTLGALGPAGLAQVPEWRATDLPREALLSTPALWRGTSLTAAPLAGRAAGFSASFARTPPWTGDAG